MKLQYIVLIIVLPVIGICQNTKIPFVQEPGKCYAKYLIDNVYEDVEIELPIFIGEGLKGAKFIKYIIQVKEESIKDKGNLDIFFEEKQNDTYDTILIVDTTST